MHFKHNRHGNLIGNNVTGLDEVSSQKRGGRNGKGEEAVSAREYLSEYVCEYVSEYVSEYLSE